MFPVAVVIFREVFEIALILSIVLAATRGIVGRDKWVLLGFLGGVFGASIVALFTEAISDAVEGMGQEIMNAGILLTASVFIGWTVIWMRRHAVELTAHLKHVGHAVGEGTVSFMSLSIIIAVTLLREGSEIVLFTYAMIASGQDTANIITGSIIGVVGGVAVGAMIYYGLIKLATKHIFKVTGWLLVFLVAGLASQAARFLSQAGFFPELSGVVWDTSWFISDQGILGQTLQILVGYSARPVAIQLIFFIVTLGGLISIMKVSDYLARVRAIANAIILAAFLTTAQMVIFSESANATRQVYSPYVEKGELEFEWKGSVNFDDRDSKDGKHKDKFEIGYGFSDFYFGEILVELEDEPGTGYKLAAVEIENLFQLTDRGQYWADLGLLVELEAGTLSGSTGKVKTKLLAEKETGQFSHTANLGLSARVGENRTGQGGLASDFAWSTRYRLSPMFEPGVEYHADFGRFNQDNDFDTQDHEFGPVIYGKIPVGNKGHKIGYDIGYLFGLSDDAPDGKFKWIVEYEIHF